MDISCIPKLINSHHIKVCDENFIPVNICKKTNEFFVDNFKNPFLIIDAFEAMNYKDVRIEILDMDQMDKLGYRLVSVSLKGMSSSRRNYSGQKRVYVLRRKTDPLGRDFELLKLPNDHQLQVDIINKRIRIKGKDAFPYIRNENASKWIDINFQIKKEKIWIDRKY